MLFLVLMITVGIIGPNKWAKQMVCRAEWAFVWTQIQIQWFMIHCGCSSCLWWASCMGQHNGLSIAKPKFCQEIAKANCWKYRRSLLAKHSGKNASKLTFASSSPSDPPVLDMFKKFCNQPMTWTIHPSQEETVLQECPSIFRLDHDCSKSCHCICIYFWWRFAWYTPNISFPLVMPQSD